MRQAVVIGRGLEHAATFVVWASDDKQAINIAEVLLWDEVKKPVHGFSTEEVERHVHEFTASRPHVVWLNDKESILVDTGGL